MSIKQLAFDGAHREILKIKNAILDHLSDFISKKVLIYYDTLGKGINFQVECMDDITIDGCIYGKKDELALLLTKLFYYANKEYKELIESLKTSEGISVIRTVKIYTIDFVDYPVAKYTISWS